MLPTLTGIEPRRRWALTLVALLGASALAPPAVRATPTEEAEEAQLASPQLASLWGPRAVEHLLNRAGFGATTAEIATWAERSPEALVEHLLDPGELPEPFFNQPYDLARRMAEADDPDARRREIARARSRDKRQMNGFLSWWFDQMIGDRAPLRERMTLFWHGFFTSSVAKVKRSYPMIRQNELFREHALGSYAELLREVVRDPAMLLYLDNDTNRRGRPNENFARELMELYTLGAGHYSEKDVQEAARALSGHSADRQGIYEFHSRQHDHGRKKILGRRGRLDAEDLVEILLRQDACARWVAGRLLAYFEGVEPSEPRLASYADLLRANGYRLDPFLRRLFLDPEFYRNEIVAARILSPVDYLVGACRRLRLEPPAVYLIGSSALLGQKLLDPPSVKGWEEGEAWITTSTLMARANLAGILLGVIDLGELRADSTQPPAIEEEAELAMADDELSMTGDDPFDLEQYETMMAEPAEATRSRTRRPTRPRIALEQLVQLMDEIGYRPRMHLCARLARRGLVTDQEIVDAMLEDLLAIEAPAETRQMLFEALGRERRALGLDEGELLTYLPHGELVLRRLAHRILSLPEAQLG